MLINLILAVGAFYFFNKDSNKRGRSRSNFNLNMIVRNLQYRLRRF